jgi:hypothetical protein
MRTSSLVILTGAIVFVVPLPGTFVLGAVLFLVGAVARWLGL